MWGYAALTGDAKTPFGGSGHSENSRRNSVIFRVNTSYSKSMNTQICHRAGGLGLGLAEFIVSPANSFTTGFPFDLGGGRAVY